MNIRLGVAASSLLALVELVGCGSDDGPTAPERCNDLLSKYCSRLIGCMVDDGTITAAQAPSSEASCNDTSTSIAPCDRAISVGTSYNACMSKLDTVACSALEAGDLPNECYGAVTIR